MVCLISLLIGFVFGQFSEKVFNQEDKVREELVWCKSEMEMLYPALPDEIYHFAGTVIEKEEGFLVIEGQALRPTKNDYLILGDIGEIDKDKSPVEMVFYVDLRLSFLNAGSDMIERKILIEEDTLIYVGPNLEFGKEISEEKRVLVSMDELNKGSRAIINTKEMVSLVLEQDVFTAQEIKMFVSQEEYQNYLK